MESLKEAILNYLKEQGRNRRPVRIKNLKNTIVPQFLTEGLQLSALLSDIQTIVKELRQTGYLLRIGSGQYVFDPNRESRGREVVSTFSARPPMAYFHDLQEPLTENRFNAIPDTILQLARSSEYLVVRNLKQYDLQHLNGLSF